MKTHFALLAVAVLFTASFGILLGDQAEVSVSAAPPQSAPNDYHNSTINFNVDLPDGQPAVGFMVEVMSVHSPSRKNSGSTNSVGFLELKINIMTMGLCEVRVYDLCIRSVYFEKIEVWPDEVLDKDITVNEPLEPDNRIHGIVRNSSNDSPIPGIEVLVRGEDINGNLVSLTNITDSSGRYTLYVPNSTEKYYISFQTIKEYYQNSFNLFLEAGIYDYDRDFYLRPDFLLSQSLHIRIKDTTTGDYQTRGTLSVEGYTEVIDDNTIYQSIYSGDKDTGWFNATMDKGAYFAYFRPSYLTKDPYVYVKNYFYVNDTELFHEIPVTIPEYIELEVEVWNSSSPLQGAYVSWREEIDHFVIGCYDYTHSTGVAYLKVPTDRVVDIQITFSNYQTKDFEVDPIGHSSLIEKNVTLEEIPFDQVKKANVTIHIVDDITGVGIPYANVRITKIGDNARYTYSYSVNATGFLKRVIEISDPTHIFEQFDFRSENYLGIGMVNGVELEEGEDKEIVIRTKRFKLEEPYLRTHLYVKDESGTPIPGLKLQVSMIGEIDSEWADVMTDINGRADLIGPPGEYSFSIYNSIKHWRNHWAIKYQKIEVKDPGLIGDITAYSTYPLDTYWGFVKDADTSEIITNANVESISVEKLDLTRGCGIREDILSNEVFLYDMSSGTDHGGYYRTKGTGTIKITYNKEGYFNKKVEIQPGTRAAQIDDVFMEPLTESYLWVNGTLVNENGEPIEGYVYIYDKDQDDHELYDSWINETGKFSFLMYPGNFSFFITNDTLENQVDVTVGPDGLEDLTLALIPTSEISGIVADWVGEPLGGVNITLINTDVYEPGIWMLTDECGEFSFEVIAGNYYLAIERTELYGAFIGTTFETNGWVDEFFEITLENRTTADIYGAVFGDAGPLVAGVPGAIVILMMDGVEVHSTTADTGGYFEFIDVDHGTNYSIEATPPLEWQPVIGSKSGYLMNSTMNITLSGASMEFDIMLPFVEYTPSGWLEFRDHLPVGENVPLDEDIIVSFSRPIDLSTFIEAFYIEPMIEVNFSLNIDGDAVVMTHDPFEPNTTYEIIIAGSVFSVDDWPLMEYEGMSWNFTTSDRMSSWKIYSVDVEVNENKNVTFIVNGVDDMSLFIVIDLFDSYQFLPSGFPGRYSLTIDGEDLEWNYMYFYHFSDEAGGEDLAIGLSGNFTTPYEPGTEWDLTASVVNAEDDGSISVEAHGPPGQTVWINIVGIGWYELEEDEEGVYKATIPAEDLEWDTVYSFLYSSSEGGTDLEPGLSRTISTTEEPIIGDDDDDDTSTSVFGKVMVYSLGCCGILLALILVILVLMVVAKRRSKGKGFDEE